MWFYGNSGRNICCTCREKTIHQTPLFIGSKLPVVILILVTNFLCIPNKNVYISVAFKQFTMEKTGKQEETGRLMSLKWKKRSLLGVSLLRVSVFSGMQSAKQVTVFLVAVYDRLLSLIYEINHIRNPSYFGLLEGVLPFKYVRFS